MTATNDKHISFDECVAILSEIARGPEGPDKFRALKTVMAIDTGTVTVPEPLNDEERIERTARLLKVLGPIGSQFAYRRAFPMAKRPINHAAPKLMLTDLNTDKSTLPQTLQQLYRMFPEIKRGGFPPGFPKGRGQAEKKAWCQKEALRIMLDRKQAEADVIAVEAREDRNEGLEDGESV